MLILPSGRVVDISTDRSKYHALRQTGGCLSSTHRQLYSLVDIVYRYIDDTGSPKRGWTEYDYVFSGYTLDSVRFANDWTEEDKAALCIWLQEKDQHRRIETARRRLHDNQEQLSVKRYSAPRYLYSFLKNRIQALPQKRASVKQWLATISNMKQNGVREEEIQWSGLYQYLAQFEQEQRVNKEQILDNLTNKNLCLEFSIEQLWGEQGGLSFKEIALRMPHQAVYRAALKLDESCICLLRYVEEGCNHRVGVVKTLNNNHHMALNKYWFALDPYGRAIANKNAGNNHSLFFDNSSDAKSAADKHAREHFGVSSGVKNNTHFDHLTLFGGEDYREWFVSLPDYQRIYFGPHFYDHNVLAHIRTTSRNDQNGKKILFIEEVQSDWHQSARRSGYNNSYWGKIANAPFKQEWIVLAIKLILIHASQNGFDGIAWPKGHIQELRYKRDIQSIKDYYDNKIPKALNQLVKTFNCKVETTKINTRDPWLHLEKSQDKWRVADGQGKFKTKAKYNNRDEAMAVITRHCKEIDFDIPVLFINEELRHQISEYGLPLYGHTIK
ncbi:MAG: hypothetical protein OQK75_08855 [Gammaproteobacteria bacterium]|nr:hypothetical protein [Gammaproteobacteria bacterium]